ncbi:MAG: MFS transporter [Treponema sp.]|nr:MFS transporter [Treponema sp.]
MSKSAKSVLLYIILFGSMFLFGFIENIKGVSYPLIKTEFGISYEQQGVMVSLLAISYVAFCFIGGIIIGSLGVKKAFISGFVLMITGLISVFFMPGFWPVAVFLLVVFAGFGLFEVSSNALATQVFTKKAALLMSLLHFFYGVGASLSPRVSGAITLNISWRYLYLFSVPLVLLIFIPSLIARFPRSDEEQYGVKKAGFFTALKTPMVWVFSLGLGFMVAVELSSSNWGSLYFFDVYNLDPKTKGAAFISNFYILFTVSRLLSGFAIEKIGYLRSLFIGVIASIIILAIGFFLGANGIYVLPVLGFFTAILWPTIIATAMGYFKNDAPVMTSAIIVIGGALNSGVQYLMGLANRIAGPAWGYRSSVLYAVLAVIVLIILARGMRRPYANGAVPE